MYIVYTIFLYFQVIIYSKLDFLSKKDIITPNFIRYKQKWELKNEKNIYLIEKIH